MLFLQFLIFSLCKNNILTVIVVGDVKMFKSEKKPYKLRTFAQFVDD